MKNIGLWLALIGVVAAFCIYEFALKTPELKTGYVDVNKLYSEFKLSKELDAKLTTVQTSRKNILDSLGVAIQSFEKKFVNLKPDEDDRRDYELMRREYQIKQKQFTEDNNQLTQDYQSQILSQLNQYVQDYSDEEGYDYIFGANGSGALMAVSKDNDLTEILIEYVNAKYSGQ